MLNRLHCTNNDAADKLIADGLAADKTALLDIFAAVDHMRFAAYVLPFRDAATGQLRSNVSLDDIWNVYSFDRKLRLMSADALARIEVAVRAMIIRHYTDFNPDPFAYTDCGNLPKISKSAHLSLLDNVERAAKKNLLPTALPELWVALEIVPFGTLTYFFEGLPTSVQEKISNTFHTTPKVFGGWLTALRKARNICAHNARFWNKRLKSKLARKIGSAPELDGLDAVLKLQTGGDSPTSFTILSLCSYCLTIIRPQSHWRSRCAKLLNTATPFILRGMGVPPNWQALTLWTPQA